MPNSINEEIGRLFKLGDKLDDKLVHGYERKLIELYKSSLETIKSDIAKMYERYGDKVTLGEMVKFQRLTNMEKFIKEQLTKLGTASNL
ncbi:MAG: hypothetical protein KAJ10_14770, partial [Thermodesulfovibrionia bacterium]|nr:hypothetical protein [Thermodesulfovibrionia bacterium]